MFEPLGLWIGRIWSSPSLDVRGLDELISEFCSYLPQGATIIVPGSVRCGLLGLGWGWGWNIHGGLCLQEYGIVERSELSFLQILEIAFLFCVTVFAESRPISEFYSHAVLHMHIGNCVTDRVLFFSDSID